MTAPLSTAKLPLVVPKSMELVPPTVAGTLVLQAGVGVVLVKALLNEPVLAGVVPVFSLNFKPMSGDKLGVAALTVTVDVPVIVLLLTDLAVMVVEPAATAVTSPVELIVATAVLLLVQVTLGLVAFDGVIVAAN